MSRRQQPIVAPKPNHPERWLTIRVYGNILYTTGAWGNNNMQLTNTNPLKEAHIDSWMKDCAEHGVTAVLWQANCGGTLTHTSSVFPLQAHHYLPTTMHGYQFGIFWVTKYEHLTH